VAKRFTIFLGGLDFLQRHGLAAVFIGALDPETARAD